MPRRRVNVRFWIVKLDTEGPLQIQPFPPNRCSNFVLLHLWDVPTYILYWRGALDTKRRQPYLTLPSETEYLFPKMPYFALPAATSLTRNFRQDV